jgi:hypothetical protein
LSTSEPTRATRTLGQFVDFFNGIGAKLPFICKQHLAPDKEEFISSESGPGMGRLAVHW